MHPSRFRWERDNAEDRSSFSRPDMLLNKSNKVASPVVHDNQLPIDSSGVHERVNPLHRFAGETCGAVAGQDNRNVREQW